MAAPTSPRVWAIGQTSTVLKWVYSGTAAIGVYRSVDGSAYTLISSVSAAAQTYTDTDLTPGTKYWYKLSDDVGVTFSSVVTVKTHECGDVVSKRRRGFALPRFKKTGSTANKQNRMVRDIEDVIEKRTGNQEPCVACITDGAIVIDCSQDCDCWDVDVDADINSITFLNCSGEDPCIRFRVPPGVTRGICGFPQGHSTGFGFGGDECTQTPINGGTSGRTMTTGKKPPRSNPGSGSRGGGAGGSGCECIPGTKGQLTVKCCTADCSMNCSSTKTLQIKICGGSPPYSITGSAGLGIKKVNGDAAGTGITAGMPINVTPPTNSGSAVAGTAYIDQLYRCTACTSGACSVNNTGQHFDVGCDDVVDGCFQPADGHSHCSPSNPGAAAMTCSAGGGIAPCLPEGTQTCPGTMGNCVHVTCDDRTAPMIAGGCNPCGVSASNKTVTVTDAQGVSVITTLGV